MLAFDGNRDGRLDLDEFTRAAARFIRARQEVTGESVTRWPNDGQTTVKGWSLTGQTLVKRGPTAGSTSPSSRAPPPASSAPARR